jgi:succinyl-diaminopimelate desuccinylase
MGRAALADRVLEAVDAAAPEIVGFTSELIRVPTVNPPGEHYADCAQIIARRLEAAGFDVDCLAAEGSAEHTRVRPRINVVGLLRGRRERPAVHLNGHYDVVPAGDGWTLDPFAGEVREGRIYGRGACDMKAGIAASLFAVEAIRRAGVALEGSVEISATPDEESGGFAGVAWLATQGRISSLRLDHVIIPEPLNVDRICIGHRGVYWFEVTTRGRIGHGSMPFLGVSAIEHMSVVLERVRRDLRPALASRTTAMPVVPEAARHATLNVNSIGGGQSVDGIQTPCVADTCRAVFDRRLLIEEDFDAARAEIQALIDAVGSEIPSFRCELRDLMVVPPVRTPPGSPVVASLDRAIQAILGRPAVQIASPGTYDHKHVDRIGGIHDCVGYGPGILDLAHQPDEWCGIDDLVNATKVLALAILDLTHTAT